MARHELSDISIQELSLVFAQKDGSEWAPRNPSARVLGVKGGKKPGFMTRLSETMKAYFSAPDTFQYPVSTDVQDDIDNDGDGAQDYNDIASALCRVSYDIQQASCIGDDNARSIAIKVAIDCFLDELKECLSGGSEKAGARHSKADLEHLNAMKEAHAKMGEHLDALTATSSNSGDGSSDDDEENADDEKAGEVDSDEKAKKKDDKPYGDVEYADPGYQEDKKERYPLDTEEHVRAAASYFGKQSNKDKYSAEQQKKIQAKIDAAEKKFGIGDDGKKAGEVDMTQEEINALVASEVAKALETAKAQAQEEAEKAQADAITERAKADAEAQAALEAANAAKAKAEADAAAILKATAERAAAPTATSASANTGGPSRLEQVLRAQLAQNPVSTRF